MNEAQLAKEQFAQWVTSEILKAKAIWIHAVYAAILPPALYNLAKNDQELGRSEQWARQNGFAWKEFGGLAAETRLYKGDNVVAVFKPEIRGTGDDRKMGFYCEIFGKRVDLGGNIVVLHRN